MTNKHNITHRRYERTGRQPEFSKETLAVMQQIIERYPEGKKKSALLPLLHIAQEESGGHLDADTMDRIASMLHIQPIEVYEVATFYTQYYLEDTGTYVIEVCRTAPCAACGAEDIIGKLEQILGISVGETTADGLFTLKTVECLGACGYGPVMQINTVFYEQLTETKIAGIIEDLRSKANKEPEKELTWAGKFFSNI
jgi:NADH-quinone oxidoreductase subunit E